MISKKREKIVNSHRNSERSNTNSSVSEENDSILNIGETFELSKDKGTSSTRFCSSKLQLGVNNSNKYKSQLYYRDIRSNLETKNLDHRQREIVLISLEPSQRRTTT